MGDFIGNYGTTIAPLAIFGALIYFMFRSKSESDDSGDSDGSRKDDDDSGGDSGGGDGGGGDGGGD